MRAMKHVLVAVASASLLLAACGDAGSESAGGGDGLGVGDDYTVLGALAELPPAPVSSFMVLTGDLTTAGELAGLERPDELDVAAVGAWLGPLTGGPSDDPVPVMVPGPEALSQSSSQYEDVHELAGWTLLDVDSFVEFSTHPHVFTVVTGDFADDTLDHLPEVAEGVRTVGEGEDGLVNFDQISAVSRTGQPVRMALGEGKLALGGDTRVVQSWVTGVGQTLADDESLARLAVALDSVDVVSAMLVTKQLGGFAHFPMPSHDDLEIPDLEFLPEHPFSAVALGWAVEGDEPRIVLAYHHFSADSAEASVDQLETLFAEGETVRGGFALADLMEVVEISAEGRVVTAVLRPVEPGTPRTVVNLLMNQDVPFIHQ